MKPCKLAIGDSITFKAATRSDFKRVRRKVVGIDAAGRPMVRYHGWSDFVVRWDEVQEIHRAAQIEKEA